jgi:hypothetical protein
LEESLQANGGVSMSESNESIRKHECAMRIMAAQHAVDRLAAAINELNDAIVQCATAGVHGQITICDDTRALKSVGIDKHLQFRTDHHGVTFKIEANTEDTGDNFG